MVSETSTRGPGGTLEKLWEGFVSPPDSARPRVWWHWMDGNVDLDGIRRDLAWMHRVGVRGVQVFDGGLGNPSIVDEPLIPGTDAWREALKEASETAHNLGIEFTVATSAGWSASGGPWVSPDDAMRKIVWSQAILAPGDDEHLLPALPDSAGVFQDSSPWGEASDRGHARDICVLAIPYNEHHDPHQPTQVRTSNPLGSSANLTDETFTDGIQLPRDPDARSSVWLEQQFHSAVTVRSCVVGIPGPHGFGAAPPVSAVLEASTDGLDYWTVAELPATRVPARTLSFPPVTATHFRLVLAADGLSAAMPSVEPGVAYPPVFRAVTTFDITQFALYEAGMVSHREVKAGFAAAPFYDALDTDARASAGTVARDRVIDVTEHVRGDILTWAPPEGSWRILRFGSTLTGQKNGPAVAEATGLEVDKLDARRVRQYIDHHLHRYGDIVISGLLSDSIEAGPQNFTEQLPAQFAERRGYDMIPWLLTVAGLLVDDALSTDLFLADFRLTISELLAEEYYRTLADAAHQRGAIYYAEALEDHRPQLGDDLAMRSRADVPMGAMWTFSPDEGPAPTYVADLKGASSVTHVYDRSFTGSEAFTSMRTPWRDSPRTLKHIADLQLTLGVTRFCIHSSPHQPSTVPIPGMAMANILGQSFSRNETWAPFAGAWVDYLARCSYLLGQGTPAVDIAYFIGEEAPVTALFGDEFNTTIPAGFDFDYLNVDALTNRISVDGGSLVAGQSRYRLLYLGGSSARMSVTALRAIEQLLDRGATVVGIPPTGPRSLSDSPEEIRALIARIWGARSQGRVINTHDLAVALSELEIEPLVRLDDVRVRHTARWVDGKPVIFVANPTAHPVSTILELNHPTDVLAAWNPVTLERVPLQVTSPRHFRVQLPAFGSSFLLPAPAVREQAVQGISLNGRWSLAIPGRNEIALPDGPQRWTELGPIGEGFSGIAVYRLELELSDAELGTGQLTLDLEDVADLAEVTINGHPAGVAWTPPYRVPASHLMKGNNVIEVAVANPWRNRLIAESSHPTGEAWDAMTAVFTPDAAILPAGLAGPVTLRRS